MSSQTLFPYVELRVEVGRDPSGRKSYVEFSTRDYLQEFTETDTFGASSVILKLTDPTFVELEAILLEGSKSSGVLEYRWGYPTIPKYTSWRQFMPYHIVPDITPTGYTLTISGKSIITETIAHIAPKTFKGKISVVVKAVVDEINMRSQEAMGVKSIKKYFIEETNDEVNIDKEWSTNNLSYLQFIREKLEPIAVSKANKKGTYKFSYDNRGYLYFRTEFYEISERAEVRQFSCLFGKPTDVISFRPNYRSRVISGAARGWLASTYNPESKQYVEKAINIKTVPSENIHNKTLAPPPDVNDPESTKSVEVLQYEPSSVVDSIESPAASGGSGPALDRISGAWKVLHQNSMTATLELVGTPENINLNPRDQFIDIVAVLPDGVSSAYRNSSGQNIHWMSGRYQIKEVRHSILGTYVITLELLRGTAPSGTDSSETVDQ